MFQRVKTAYKHLAQSLRKPTAGRRSVGLSILTLEERATPALTVTLLAPIEPPSSAVVAFSPPPAAPTQPALASGAAVRADLFGVGTTEKPVNELEEVLVSDQAAKKDVAAEPVIQQPDIDDADAGGAVMIEEMVFVPRVE